MTDMSRDRALELCEHWAHERRRRLERAGATAASREAARVCDALSDMREQAAPQGTTALHVEVVNWARWAGRWQGCASAMARLLRPRIGEPHVDRSLREYELLLIEFDRALGVDREQMTT